MIYYLLFEIMCVHVQLGFNLLVVWYGEREDCDKANR